MPKIIDLWSGRLALVGVLACGCTATRTQRERDANEAIGPMTAVRAVSPAEEKHVRKGTAMSSNRLGLEDSEFWTNPKRTADDEAARLLDQEFSGVIIGAPAKVPVDLQQTLPLVAIHAGTYRETWEVGFERHALFTAMDLDMNMLYANWGVDQDAEFPTSNPAEAPPGRMASVQVLDVRERLGLPWHEGRYLLTLILRERSSNRVDVELGRGSHRDEEVEKFLASEREKLAPPRMNPVPDEGFPSYRPVDGSPEVPAELGIEMRAERVVVLRRGTIWALKGAFRLAVLPHELVRPGLEAPPGAPAATAIVAITLLATGANVPAPNILRLAVPSYDPVKPGEANPVLTGHFAVDLMTHPEIPRIAQTVYLYAFSGPVLAGPVTTGLVPESRLPRRDP